jgi:hypothetical protein
VIFLPQNGLPLPYRLQNGWPSHLRENPSDAQVRPLSSAVSRGLGYCPTVPTEPFGHIGQQVNPVAMSQLDEREAFLVSETI